MTKKYNNGTIVFLDTETGGLAHDDRPWEYGFVVEKPEVEPTYHLWHVVDFFPAKADPIALQFGGFYDRHPGHRDYEGVPPEVADAGLPESLADSRVEQLVGVEAQLMLRFERLTRGALIVCCNDSFDVPKVGDAMHRAGLAWGRYYRTVDAYGYAAGALGLHPATDSERIATALGVDREKHGKAHNALVDALYARDMFNAALRLAGAVTP